MLARKVIAHLIDRLSGVGLTASQYAGAPPSKSPTYTVCGITKGNGVLPRFSILTRYSFTELFGEAFFVFKVFVFIAWFYFNVDTGG